MKKFKRIFALLLSVVMILGLAATAWAADDDESTDETTTTTTGSITIENSVNGSTYTIYKIFSATYDSDGNVAYYTTSQIAELMKGYTATVDGEEISCPFTFVAGTDGNYYVTVNEGVDNDDVIAWLEAFMEEYSENFGSTEATGNGGSLVIEDLAYGYYYITTKTGSVVTIDSVTPDVTVIDKNQDTTNGTKTMTIGEEKNLTSKSVEYGTTVDFTVTLDATNYVGETKVKSYTIKDELSDGLDLDTESIVVYVNNVELTLNSDYEITYTYGDGDSVTGFVIVINWTDGDNNSIYDSEATVKITYSATVTEEGDCDGEKETNTATFYYNSTKINEVETDVTVYSFWLVKTDSSNDSVLSGAGFTLYYDSDYDNPVYFTEVTESDVTYYLVCDKDTEGATTTIEAGYVEIKGLAEGTYYLVETTAPDGYIALTEAETVTVGSNGTTVTFNNDGTTYEDGGVNVANTAGSKLPSTGGMGRTILYAIGIILILGAGIVLVVKRRAKAN